MTEIKDLRGTLYFDNQIQKQVDYAASHGLPFYNPVVSRTTVVHESVLQKVEKTGGTVQVFNSSTGMFSPYGG
ncbi:MAG: hypothetical protein MZV49_09175 [Rhodopseudomonas palustris]|nr:hypothetical protein [Rhodopseudomonas palustris]